MDAYKLFGSNDSLFSSDFVNQTEPNNQFELPNNEFWRQFDEDYDFKEYIGPSNSPRIDHGDMMPPPPPEYVKPQYFSLLGRPGRDQFNPEIGGYYSIQPHFYRTQRIQEVSNEPFTQVTYDAFRLPDQRQSHHFPEVMMTHPPNHIGEQDFCEGLFTGQGLLSNEGKLQSYEDHFEDLLSNQFKENNDVENEFEVNRYDSYHGSAGCSSSAESCYISFKNKKDTSGSEISYSSSSRYNDAKNVSDDTDIADDLESSSDDSDDSCCEKEYEAKKKEILERVIGYEAKKKKVLERIIGGDSSYRNNSIESCCLQNSSNNDHHPKETTNIQRPLSDEDDISECSINPENSEIGELLSRYDVLEVQETPKSSTGNQDESEGCVMDFQVSVPGPFSYLVHEHARSILAIQELQREVSSLLEFRDNVLTTLPHLHSRAQLQDRAYHSLTHDLSGGPHIPHGAPSSQARISKTAQCSPHHMTSSGEDVKQQRPNSSSTTSGVAPTTTSSSSSGNSSSSSTGGKSLSEAHNSAVADSGFSTDKAGGSMGKSSSSSAGDHLSGVDENHHWMSVEPEMPLGSAEDELWHLLDVIQRKGTKLRHELEQAEIQERDRSTHPPTSSTSDPLASPRPHPAYRDYWPHSLPPTGHYPPRSDVLPPPPPPPPLGVGAEAEAWAAVERLRHDRQYLVGRVSWAEGEAAASHQRLLDLHNQLMVLAGEKRRLEEQLRGMRLDHRLDPRLDPRYDQRTVDPRVEMRNDLNLQFVKTNGVSRDGPASAGGIVHSVMGGTNTVHIMSDSSSSGTTTTTTTTSSMGTKPRRLPSNVTVNVSSSGDGQQQSPDDTIRGRIVRSASSVRIGNERDIVLPRVLKVPIRDRNKQNPDLETSHSTKDASNKDTIKESSPSSDNGKGSDRVVIERERRAPGKADGGLSMPVSLLKGVKIKVKPDKQRISAILREKDVVELQRQLLTTVMETEVLRKQVEILNEEWASKSTEFEADQRHSRDALAQLKLDNAEFKAKLEERDKIRLNYRDIGTHCVPSSKSVGVMTNDGSTDSEDEPSHTVYHSPNIKYDVVVHEENSPRSEANNNLITEGRKAPPAIEKPPRKSREGSNKTANGTWNSSTNVHGASPVPLARRKDVEDLSGRDSLGRSTTASRSRLAHSARSTPTATPRSSPAPSLATGRTARAASQEGGRSTPVGRSSSSISSRFPINRRDSVKTGVSSVGGGPSGGSHGGLSKASSTSSSVGSGGVTSQHKDPSLLVCDETLPGQRRSISMSRTNPAIEEAFVSQTSGKVTNTMYNNTVNASPHAVSSLGVNDESSSVMNHYMGRNVISNPTTPTTNTDAPLLVSSPKRTTGPLTNIGSQSATTLTTDSSKKNQRKKLSASDLYNQNYNESAAVVPGLGSSADAWLSQLASEGSSAASSISISSSDSFYDSITTDSTDKLMQVEVAFEWNPVPQQEIRYLPPAAHMWTPATEADKRMPPGLVSATPQLMPKAGKNPLWTKKIPFLNESQLENYGRSTRSGNLKKPLDDISDSQKNDGVEQCSADSLEDDIRGFEAVGKMRNRLRAINGAVRVKNVDRPTVLPHTQGDNTGDNKNEDPAPESGPEQVTGKLFSSSSRDSASSDLNARVHQILSRIAASAQ